MAKYTMVSRANFDAAIATQNTNISAIQTNVDAMTDSLEENMSPNVLWFNAYAEGSKELNGLTLYFIDQSTVKINGTATKNTYLYMNGSSTSNKTLDSGTYYYANVATGERTSGAVYLRYGSSSITNFVKNESNIVSEKSFLQLYIASGITFTDRVITFSLTKGEDAPSAIYPHGKLLCIDADARERIGDLEEEVENIGLSHSVKYDIELVRGWSPDSKLELTVQNATGVDKFKSSFRTPKFFRATSITSINGTTDSETVNALCFDDNMTALGKTAINSLASGTKWVGISIENCGTLRDKKITVNAVSDYEQPVYSSMRYTETTAKSFSFEIFKDDGNPHFDNGYVILPPNYEASGDKKVPLVIYCHGSNGYLPKSTTQPKSYGDYLKYVANSGYAVADCSCFGEENIFSDDEYTATAVSDGNSRFTPMSVICYKSLYQHLIKCYNISPDDVYVFGKSNGGLATAYLSITKPFPIKAVGSLAGSVSIPYTMGYTKGKTIRYYANAYGMTGHDLTYEDNKYHYEVRTDDDKAFLISSIDKYKDYDPILLLSTTNKTNLVTALMNHGWIGSYNEDWTDVQTIANAAYKDQPTPMKVWIAVDDDDVPIDSVKAYKKMVDNYGGTCELRTFPTGTGKHHCVDTSASAPRVSVTPKYSTTVTVPVAYKELVDWFDSWQNKQFVDSKAEVVAAIKSDLDAKQDAISDLDTIRSGAEAGSTALQEHQDISGKADKDDTEPLHGTATLIYSNTLTEAVDSLYINFGDADGYRALFIKTFTNRASASDTLLCLFNTSTRSTDQSKPILPINGGLQVDTITRFAVAMSVGGNLVGLSHGSGTSNVANSVNIQGSCSSLGQNSFGTFKSVMLFGFNGTQIPANSSFKIYGVKGGII